MDWSSDAVLDFGPRNHCRYLRGTKRPLLWPAWAWRVVAPEVKDRKLNPLQRVVLRLHVAGCRRFVESGELLGLDPELVAYVAKELEGMGLLEEDGSPTQRSGRFLEEAEVDVGDLRVGWVFQNAVSGKLFPRFVSELPLATADADDSGYPQITSGTKGNPFTMRAFIVPSTSRPGSAPTPREILDAARRHRRHTKRHRRAQIDVGVEAMRGVDQVSLISAHAEPMHLLTFAYVPESESEELPWYVTEPFGFGASADLRDHLESIRVDASGPLRKYLDDITGAAKAQHRDAWNQMQTLLREEARARVDRALPRGPFAADEVVRRALEEVFLELARLEQAEEVGRVSTRALDTAYLRLRQAVESGLTVCHTRHPPGDVWRKLYGHRGPMRRDPAMAIIRQCARAVGFPVDAVPSSVLRAKPGQVQWACRGDAGRIRPTVAALLLGASDDTQHPLRDIAARHAQWLMDVDHVADAAGGQVHAAAGERRGLNTMRDDVHVCVAVLKSLLDALGGTNGGAQDG